LFEQATHRPTDPWQPARPRLEASRRRPIVRATIHAVQCAGASDAWIPLRIPALEAIGTAAGETTRADRLIGPCIRAAGKNQLRLSLPRFFSRVAAPIPFTSSSSSTEVNGPCASRYWTIALALVAPIPVSSRVRVSASAVLRLIAPVSITAPGLVSTGSDWVAAAWPERETLVSSAKATAERKALLMSHVLLLSVSQRGTSLPRAPSNLIGHTSMSNHDAAFCEPRRAFQFIAWN